LHDFYTGEGYDCGTFPLIGVVATNAVALTSTPLGAQLFCNGTPVYDVTWSIGISSQSNSGIGADISGCPTTLAVDSTAGVYVLNSSDPNAVVVSDVLIPLYYATPPQGAISGYLVIDATYQAVTYTFYHPYILTVGSITVPP